MDHKRVAETVLKAVGEDNIVAAAHCATRLRLVLKDSSKVDQTMLDNDDDIKGTFESDGQYQVIVGPGDVNKVYAEMTSMTDIKEASTDNLKEIAQEGQKKNPIMALVKVLSDIFVPIIPALVAGGLLMAINNILTSPNLFGPQSVVEMYPAIADLSEIINLLASAPFAFLPVLIGFSATQRFGGNGYLGAAMAMAMVMPELINGNDVATAMADGSMPYWNIFGLPVAQAGYQGSVIPVLAVSYILANLEKFFHKHIPNAFDFTFTPMLSIIITGLLTFIIVGPIMRIVSDGVTDGLVWLYDTAGAAGLGIFGFLYSPIVITGLHQSFPAIETALLANVEQTGGTFIFPVASMANIAQGGAAIAVFLITKRQKTKNLASSAGVSAMLGITEPAIFGVNLKLRFPFFCAMIASGIASVLIGLFHVLAVAMGPASIIGFISISATEIPSFLLSGVVSFVIAFDLTFVYGKRKMPASEMVEEESTNNDKQTDDAETKTPSVAAIETIVSPVAGQAQALKDVADPVFSQEMMGKGIAITPDSDEIYSPVDGVVSVAYESKHAYGLQSDDGAEVLIHLGIDTVNLEGQHFTAHHQKDDRVKKGDLLGTMDRSAIQKAGYDDTVMVIVTNTANYNDVVALTNEKIASGDNILEVE